MMFISLKRRLPFILLITLIGFIFHLCSVPQKEECPLNVVVIMADDLGYETIGANGGSSYKTPEIDNLAKNGIRFGHCYAQPLCTPSRVKIMTGIYNVRNYVDFGLLEENQTTFGNLFKKAGYETCIVGKWQLGKNPDSPKNAGFQHHCLWQLTEGRTDSKGRDTRYSKPVLEIDGKVKTFEAGEYGPDLVKKYGLDFIEKSHQSGKPFLLYYPMMLTHCPFSPTPESPEWTKDDTTVMTYKGKAHYFEDMVCTTDRIVGEIKDKLKSLGIEKNTLIIFTGDNGTDKPVVSMWNGEKIAGEKGKTIDAGTRVPLIASCPKFIKPAAECNDLVDFSDLLPTICEAAGIQIPDSLTIDGRSFLSQLKGDKGSPRDWIYCWFSRKGKEEEAKVFARNHRYKLYQSGEFFEIPEDRNEKTPLNYNDLTNKDKEVYHMLDSVLKHYKERRLECVPNKNK